MFFCVEIDLEKFEEVLVAFLEQKEVYFGHHWCFGGDSHKLEDVIRVFSAH